MIWCDKMITWQQTSDLLQSFCYHRALVLPLIAFNMVKRGLCSNSYLKKRLSTRALKASWFICCCIDPISSQPPVSDMVLVSLFIPCISSLICFCWWKQLWSQHTHRWVDRCKSIQLGKIPQAYSAQSMQYLLHGQDWINHTCCQVEDGWLMLNTRIMNRYGCEKTAELYSRWATSLFSLDRANSLCLSAIVDHCDDTDT